jgi:F-type H+-transporting ATPase subunit delta
MAGDITTIARPYAEAVFAIAKEHDTLDRWSEELTQLSAIINDPLLCKQIGNPKIGREQMHELISAVAHDSLSAESVNLVRILGLNDRLLVIPEIARLFDQFKAAQQGRRRVVVRTAFPIEDTHQQTLMTALQAYFNTAIELSLVDDPDLIGGIEIRADDVVIDGSISGRLRQLANELQF